MKYLIAFALLFTISCAPKQIISPVAQKAYTADQVINALGTFQDAAIGANAQGQLSDSNTKLIITYVKSAVPIVLASPTGWKNTIGQGLIQLKQSLPAEVAVKYDVYISLLIAMVYA